MLFFLKSMQILEIWERRYSKHTDVKLVIPYALVQAAKAFSTVRLYSRRVQKKGKPRPERSGKEDLERPAAMVEEFKLSKGRRRKIYPTALFAFRSSGISLKCQVK